jgi:hypothetical protein
VNAEDRAFWTTIVDLLERRNALVEELNTELLRRGVLSDMLIDNRLTSKVAVIQARRRLSAVDCPPLDYAGLDGASEPAEDLSDVDTPHGLPPDRPSVGSDRT